MSIQTKIAPYFPRCVFPDLAFSTVSQLCEHWSGIYTYFPNESKLIGEVSVTQLVLG